jgi:lipopolysaccharide transport system permease protein
MACRVPAGLGSCCNPGLNLRIGKYLFTTAGMVDSLPMALMLTQNPPINFLRKLAQHRGLIKNLVIRDLKARYVGSAMGFFWSVIHPLVLLVSYTFVFSVVLKQQLGPEMGISNFAVYLFCGILPWLLFQETLNRSSNVLIDHASLITKTLFPAEILPVSILLANLVNHIIGLAILESILVIGFHHVGWLILLVPIYLVALMLFALGLAWFISSVQVFLRDTAQVMTVILTFWFWFTPIFFDERRIPSRLVILMRLNPLAEVVIGYRRCFLSGEMPSGQGLLYLYVIAGAVFIGGGLFFRYIKKSFADVL